MNTPISRESAEHYCWGEVCDGWHLLKHDSLSIIQERVPPGAAEVRHRHHQARQFFYVLTGIASLEVDGQRHRLHAGQGLHVPPGAAHCLRNDDAVDLEFLVISSPKSHGDRELVP